MSYVKHKQLAQLAEQLRKTAKWRTELEANSDRMDQPKASDELIELAVEFEGLAHMVVPIGPYVKAFLRHRACHAWDQDEIKYRDFYIAEIGGRTGFPGSANEFCRTLMKSFGMDEATDVKLFGEFIGDMEVAAVLELNRGPLPSLDTVSPKFSEALCFVSFLQTAKRAFEVTAKVLDERLRPQGVSTVN